MAVAGGTLIEKLWDRTNRDDEPPITGFAAEQLATAHWFDQEQTRQLLGWRPAVSLEEGWRRLAAHHAEIALDSSL